MNATTLLAGLATLIVLGLWHWTLEPFLVGAIAQALGTPGTALGDLPFLFQVGLYLLRLMLIFEGVGRCLLLAVIPARPHLYPTSPDAIPGLDQTQLATYTDQLRALGFQSVWDYTLPNVKGMARLFIHPQKHCFAEVSQMVDAARPWCSFTSLLADDWVLTTADRTIPPTMYGFQRLPRTLLMARSGMRPDQLLSDHLSWRSHLLTDLSLTIRTNLSVALYCRQETRHHQLWRQRIARSSILWRTVVTLGFWLHPKHQWLGDYPALAQQAHRFRPDQF